MSSHWTEPEGEKFALGSLQEQARWKREYHRIVDDVRDQERRAASESLGVETDTVGQRLPRNDVLFKVRGKARYAANIELEGMLHACFVRSEHPHARILSVDTSKAEKAPGVRAIITAEDAGDELIGTLVTDTPVLAKDRVRYVGEAIAAVAADTADAAAAACQLVEVEYELLPAILTPEEALADGAAEIDPEGNVIISLHNERGDIEAGMRAADVVLENTYSVEQIDHCFLEPPSGVGFIDPDGVLTIMVCTQYPHYHHKQVARVTGLPMEKVRVVQTVVGGAFGGKMDNTVECAIALLVLKTNLPVRMIYTREEVFTTTTKRHPMKVRQKLGATGDGKFTGLDVEFLLDGGAYRSYSITVSGRCVIHAGMPYLFPNMRVDLTTVFTNHVPCGAMRSFGIVKTAFALESQINEMADRLGLSQIEIRRRNGFVDGDQTATGQTLYDVGFLKTLDAVEPIFARRKAELAAAPPADGKRRGLGIACLGYGIGYSGIRNPSTARVRVAADGTVTAFCGTPDIGTGSDMSLAQIAAQSAGISVNRVNVISGDSTKTDDSGPTSASRTTYFSGNAAYIAGQDFKRQFEAAIAKRLAAPLDQVRLEADTVSVRNDRMEFAEACRLIADQTGDIVGYGKFDPDIEANILTLRGNPYPTYTYATHLVEIEIDEELGSIDLVHVWAAHDGGTIVNPMGTEGQIEGGVAQGLGQAVMEKVVRENGYVTNPHYRDYLLPGAKDVPLAIECIFVDNHDRTGPYGAKGVAEVSLIPIPAAMAGAITDASGIRPTHLPMESEYLLDLIKQRDGGAS
ncbi:MAG: xanthine dehydrogenase family protein molybdopterin-binding subunit [Proteobacteria bacterium]|nr:xanthine dehydrogenase family protein molybdopterin-binding subunit [Pseudomonadota bacterium]